MRVLMLGWEFPPFITGGLGTACFGLTRALDRRGIPVTFVLPQSVEHDQPAQHVSLLTPRIGSGQNAESISWTIHPPDRPGRSAGTGDAETASGESMDDPLFEHAQFIGVPAEFVHPYQRTAGEGPVGEAGTSRGTADDTDQTGATGLGGAAQAGSALTDRAHLRDAVREVTGGTGEGGDGFASDYSGDMIAQVERYAHFCLAAARHARFDVIHAHDWMTYPAGLLLARASGKPLVVHVHSTEFDRSGEHVNQRIYDIERRGMHGAMRVITVSQLTKHLVVGRYAIPEHKVEVVYNGVDLEPAELGMTGIRSKDRIVLYFGRITYQKGPEYFIQAAKRVLEYMPNVTFVVAGSGDQAKSMIEMAANLGIGHKVLFTGFLRGRDIQRVFQLADLYVMPSVSEPFGIAPLEAMSHNVPVLISRTSGVSEVLTHALKVDFWDIDDMANKIIAVLKYPSLKRTLQEHGAFEVRRLTWDGAAARCDQIYRTVASEMHDHTRARAGSP